MNRTRRNAGMTLLELMIGLAALTFIGLATASMMAAAGTAWESRADHQAQNESLRLTANRINTWVRESQRIVASHAVGSKTELLIWADDDNFPGEVNLGELMLITHDSADDTLTLYAADLTPAQKQNAGANPSYPPATVGAASFPATFRGYSAVGEYPLAEGISRFDLTLVQGDTPYTSVHIVMGVDANRISDTQVATVAGVVRTPEQTIDFGYGAGSGGEVVVVGGNGGNNGNNGNNGGGNARDDRHGHGHGHDDHDDRDRRGRGGRH